VQIEQTDPSGWALVGTIPVMKNSPWLRRVGMLGAGASRSFDWSMSVVGWIETMDKCWRVSLSGRVYVLGFISTAHDRTG
jgi:hypothetical protein